jgi:hypothetical protein
MSKRLRTLLAAATATIACGAVFAASPASAEEPLIQHLLMEPSSTQAGGHPDVFLDLQWNTSFNIETGGEGEACAQNPPCLNAKTIAVHWPTGFIGNPHVAKKCTLAEFSTSSCPVDSQIGVFEINLGFWLYFPAYNMETNPEQAGLLALRTPLISSSIYLALTGRTDSDYGLSAISSPQLRGLDPGRIRGHLWGVPADPIHDVERFVSPMSSVGACYREFFPTEGCPPGLDFVSPTFAKATIPLAPFLQNPTTCGEELFAGADIEYYGAPSAPRFESPYPPTTGCNQIGFNPSITAKPTTPRADTASGLDTVLKVPQPQSPTTPASSEIRTSRIMLPPGFSINPNAADGKVACPETQTGIGTLFGATCPEFSKIGTAQIDVAALPAPIPGAIYLAEPRPDDPYRILLTGDGFATHVKVLGSVEPDPQTGQLTITFEDLPQTPLQEFNLHVFGSERGFLATPEQCGTFEVHSEFVPWNKVLTTRQATSYMTLGEGPNGAGCPNGPRPFDPSLRAGTSNTTAGSHAPFSLTVKRPDGHQNMTALDVSTPPGFAASLRGVPYCPESAIAQLNAPGYAGAAERALAACPAASQVGTATAGAGAGSHPLFVPGKVYLAGPYKGAPLSLMVVLPAVSGPYDLGVVAVRAAITVDPITAQVRASSDPLPQILEGVPLRARFIEINLNRPNFTVNPTDCETQSVTATLSGDEGAIASPSNPFQVANCSDLPYGPKLGLKLTGGVKRLGHPAIRAIFRAKPGEANTSTVQVALPKGELLDNGNIDTICTRPDFARNACPEGSRLGSALAATPLLDAPLSGNVYLRANPNRNLPDVVADLEGQFDIELAGRIDTVKGGSLRTTFAGVPDAPVSFFELKLLGGSRGLLQNSRSLCAGKPKKADTRMVGQNGAVVKAKTKLQVACKGSAGAKRHKRRADTRKAG